MKRGLEKLSDRTGLRRDLTLVDPPWAFHWPVGLAFALFCGLLSYPGRANGDSLYLLIASTKPGMTNNWHSATLGWLWGLGVHPLGQPAAALAVQALLFGLFAAFLPQLPATLRGRATLFCELLLRGALAGCAGYIGKDAVMLLTLFIGVQLIRQHAQGRMRGAGALLLLLTTLLFLLVKAPNFLVIVAAIALVLPFFVLSLRRYLALLLPCILLGTLAVPANRMVDSLVFGARDLHPDKQLILFDLAGISARSGHDAFAGIKGWPTRRLPTPASCYVPNMWDSFAHWAPCGGYGQAYDALSTQMMRRWIIAIAAHPLAYLEHRAAYAGHLLTSRDHLTWGLDGEAINDATNAAALAEMRRGMAAMRAKGDIDLWRPSFVTGPMAWLERTLFKFPKVQWCGLIACLAILLWSWMRRQHGVRLGAIVAAGLGAGNFGMLFVFGVADPARYMLPTIGLAYIALLALMAPPERSGAAQQV